MRSILYIILFYLFYRIVRSFLFPKRPKVSQKNNPSLKGEEMVLDPICQTYFPKTEALTIKNRKEITYFCSEECREKSLNTMK